MRGNLSPTKANLIQLKNQLKLAEEGHDLLERKRNVMMRELVSMIKDAQKLQEEINSVFEKAYESLRYACLDLGMEFIEEIGLSVPEYVNLSVRMRSVMGVEVPEIVEADLPEQIPYGIHRTNSALDRAYVSFREVLSLIIKVSLLENAVYRLAYEVKKVRKRVSALENVIIPNIRENLKRIQETLEEWAKEDFVRLKMIKERMGKEKSIPR
ncbi:MAG TPA: V-type ATP synthase subunit D [Thermotoga sp.]|nr:V-type ATP synthase subunit D [Thermotoga sp.]